MREGGCHTSSLLEPMLSRAIGLLGALLAVGAASGAEVDWGTGDTPRVWVTATLPRVVERYCFTCCLCACWMWYLVGFSKWVWTCSVQVSNSCSFQRLLKKQTSKQARQICVNEGSSYFQDLHRHLCWRRTGSIWWQRDGDGWSGVGGPQLGGSGLLLRLTSLLLLGLFSHQLLPQQHPRRHG